MLNFQNIKKSWLHMIIAVFATLAMMALLSTLYQIQGAQSGQGPIHRIITLLGGNFFGGGYIQSHDLHCIFLVNARNYRPNKRNQP